MREEGHRERERGGGGGGGEGERKRMNNSFFPLRTEENILLSTAILARSIQFVTDKRLLTGECRIKVAPAIIIEVELCVSFAEFVSCVLGESGGGGCGKADVEGKEETEEEGDGKKAGKKIVLRDRIIQRIDHPNDEVRWSEKEE